MVEKCPGRESGQRQCSFEMDSKHVRAGFDLGSILRRVHPSPAPMSAPVENILSRVQSPGVESESETRAANVVSKNVRVRTLLALPAATLLAMGVHAWAQKQQPVPEPQYFLLLQVILGAGILATILQRFSAPVRKWVTETCPILAAGVVLLAVWEIVTSGLKLLPMPYFPGPGAVWKSMLDDRKLLLESTVDSLVRLLAGYAVGGAVALITGVCIGWFAKARYWGMPLLKIIGPSPPTSWLPLSLLLSPYPNMTP